MIYKAMKILNLPKDHNVIEYGEYGMTFYIILKGKVSVKIPTKFTKEFTFRELWEFICDDSNLILKDKKYDKVLETIQSLLPEVIQINKKSEQIVDISMLKDILNSVLITKSIKKNNNNFPEFTLRKNQLPQFNSDLSENEITYSFELTMLNHTTDLNVGSGFGELALLNNVPRSATITTIEDSWFAVLDKSDFKAIMGRIYKRKFATLIKVIDNAMIFKDLNRGVKE